MQNRKNLFQRKLSVDLPEGKSAFLWGARKTGKSTFLKMNFPDSLYYDFLKTDLYFEFSQNPSRFREQIIGVLQEKPINNPVILDEIQKIPDLLNEVHYLIENHGVNFILCGSSARKLKRGHANMLGGRAWRFSLLPLCFYEIPQFNLLKGLNNGLIPSHYLEGNAKRSLKSYVQDYLKEEIFAEGLVRNIPAFSRFTNILGFCNGEMTNFTSISRECGVDSKTVKEYFQILEDTLTGILIYPFSGKLKRNLISKTPKFYLFDVGVAGHLERRFIEEPIGSAFGRAFEHFILMEIIAQRSYSENDYDIHFWRTTSGIEVDFILGNGEVAIEVKGKANITNKDTRHLRTFIEKYKPKKSIVVCMEKKLRKIQSSNIDILPWETFLEKLWEGKVL